MAIWTYVGNVKSWDTTSTIVVTDAAGATRNVRQGQGVDLTAPQLATLQASYIFASGGADDADYAGSIAVGAGRRLMPVQYDPATMETVPDDLLGGGGGGLDYTGLDDIPNAQQIRWGTDANLYRVDVGEVGTDGNFTAQGNVYGTDFNAVQNVRAWDDDPNYQIELGNVGLANKATIKFANDTTLYRDAGGLLRTPGNLNVAGGTLGVGGTNLVADSVIGRWGSQWAATRAATGDTAFAVQVANTSYALWRAGGEIVWGNNGASFDTNLYRSAANILKTDDEFHAAAGIQVSAAVASVAIRANQAAGNNLLTNYLVTSHAIPAFAIMGNGRLDWGAGNASALDTNLYRDSANVLKTDDSLVVAGTLTVGGAAVMTNPMTTAGDVIVGGASGVPARLAKGANGTYLGVDGSGNLAWSTPAGGGGGMTNPMTTQYDLILGGASGAATRLAKGANNQVLTVNGSGQVVWANSAAGFANPMTTAGDLILGGSSGTPGRLAKGSNGNVLTVDGSGNVVWAAPSGGGGGIAFADLDDIPIAQKIRWGTDVNLYRFDATNLRTDHNFTAAGNVSATNVTAQFLFGYSGIGTYYEGGTSPGSCIAKVPWYDTSGNFIGYVPVYDDIYW